MVKDWTRGATTSGRRGKVGSQCRREAVNNPCIRGSQVAALMEPPVQSEPMRKQFIA